MFIQKEDRLQEGNMLIHSWYHLGRGTPHPCSPCAREQRSPPSKTGLGLEAGGELQKNLGPLAWEPWNLKSSVVPPRIPPETEVQRRLRVDISIHWADSEAGNSKPLPHPPGSREANDCSALLSAQASSSCCPSGLHQLDLTHHKARATRTPEENLKTKTHSGGWSLLGCFVLKNIKITNFLLFQGCLRQETKLHSDFMFTEGFVFIAFYPLDF